MWSTKLNVIHLVEAAVCLNSGSRDVGSLVDKRTQPWVHGVSHAGCIQCYHGRFTWQNQILDPCYLTQGFTTDNSQGMGVNSQDGSLEILRILDALDRF